MTNAHFCPLISIAVAPAVYFQDSKNSFCSLMRLVKFLKYRAKARR